MKETCREVLAQVYLYIDGEILSQSERTFIRVHLEECVPCLQRLGLEQEVSTMIARLRGSDHCPKALVTRIVALIEES